MLWYAGGRLQRWKFNYSNKRRGIMIDKCQYQLSAPKCVQKQQICGTLTAHTHTYTRTPRLWSRSRPSKTEQGHCASGASQVESSSPRLRPIWIRCRLTFSASASVPQCLCLWVRRGVFGMRRWQGVYVISKQLQPAQHVHSLCVCMCVCECDTVGCNNKLPVLLLKASETRDLKPETGYH